MPSQQMIGHYRILSKLGEGGMGAVYCATDTKLNRDVAIKVLPDAFAEDPDRLARFTREAQLLAALNHPNIAAIYGVEDRALVLELVEGPTLADRIAQGPVPLEEALPIARQIAEALEYAHEKGIVHRDLKPANVKITPEGRVKVLDFGLAKALTADGPAANPASSPTLTMRATIAGTIMGTAAYMSPEQAKGKPADRRADIWAFGIVLAEMIAGRSVFSGETVSEILAAVILKDPEIPAAPPAVRQLLRRCLDRDPTLRLQAIGEARIALANPLVAAAADESPVPPPAPARRPSRVPWIVAALAGLAAVAFAGLWLRRPSEEVRNVRFSIPPPEKKTFGTGTGAAISPDGRHLAFTAEKDDETEIWVRDLDAASPRPLVGTTGVLVVATIFWSPDSRFLGFFQDGKLKKVDTHGSQPVALCDAPSPRGGSWGSRDVIVFAPSGNAALMRVSAAGGVPSPVSELDSKIEIGHRWPSFLPDGRHFLFLARATNQDKNAIWMGDIDSKNRRPVVASVSNAAYDPRGFLLFAREGNLVAAPWDATGAQAAGEPFPVAEQVEYTPNNAHADFSVSENGVLAWINGSAEGNMQLTWFNREGKPLGTVGPAGQMTTAAISPDGKTVATERLDPRTSTNDLWLHDTVRNTDSQFTFDAGSEEYPAWSPDGSRIAFSSNRDHKYAIWAKPSTGNGAEELLLEWPSPVFVTDWSRDGRFLVFHSRFKQTRADILVLSDPLDPAKRKAWPYLQTPAVESAARLSPDGKWMAYVSDESHDEQIYVSSFPGKEAKFRISTTGGHNPFWSRDGKELFFYSHGRVLMGVKVAGGPQFEHTAPQALFQTRVITTSRPAISPDGRRFLMPSLLDRGADTPIHVATNWRAGVKR